MLDAGTWPGGYVRCDDGSVIYTPKGQAVVYGYSGSGSGSEACGSDDCFSTGSDEWSGSGTDEGGNNDKDYNEDKNAEVPVANTYKQGTVSFNGVVNLYGGPEGYGMVSVRFIGNYKGNYGCIV